MIIFLRKKANLPDFESTLSEGEKLLAKHYKRVLNRGKVSRTVVILVPELLRCFINTLLEKINKFISSKNCYIFAVPKIRIQWHKDM